MLTRLAILLSTAATAADIARRAWRRIGRTPTTDPRGNRAGGLIDRLDDRERAAALQQRYLRAWAKTRGGPAGIATPAIGRPRLLRRTRHLPIPASLPPHPDPPLSPVHQAEVACAWPFIVSSYLRESHVR